MYLELVKFVLDNMFVGRRLCTDIQSVHEHLKPVFSLTVLFCILLMLVHIILTRPSMFL